MPSRRPSRTPPRDRAPIISAGSGAAKRPSTAEPVDLKRWQEAAIAHASVSLKSISTPHLLLRVSRPYYWLVTIWLYLLPTGGKYELLSLSPFWLGLAYCTLPLNAMCYLMNDIADVQVDEGNHRKGGELLGAKESETTLQTATLPALLIQLPFLACFAVLCGAMAWPWFGAVFAVNWLYNFGPRFSGNYAPLDLVCPCGYILVVPLSCWLNALPYPPLRSWAHAALLVLRTQLWIQTFDIDSDADAGRRNTAVRLGLRGSQLLLLVMLLGETAFVHTHFDHWPLQSLSVGSLALVLGQMALNASSPAMATQVDPETINRTFLILGLGGLGLMGRVWVDAAFE